MHDIEPRLIRCFTAVFPDVPADLITTYHQNNTTGWDSVATATLFAVIEEEFAIELDLDDLQNLDSFARLQEYLSRRASH